MRAGVSFPWWCSLFLPPPNRLSPPPHPTQPPNDPPQEHLSLLRALALAFPGRYPDLAALADPDPEVDFFLNVAHLQLHRRARWVGRFNFIFLFLSIFWPGFLR